MKAKKIKLSEITETSRKLLDAVQFYREFLGPRWTEKVNKHRPSILSLMEKMKTTSPLNAVIPVAKQMSDAGENPMLILAIATEMCLEQNMKKIS